MRQCRRHRRGRPPTTPVRNPYGGCTAGGADPQGRRDDQRGVRRRSGGYVRLHVLRILRHRPLPDEGQPDRPREGEVMPWTWRVRSSIRVAAAGLCVAAMCAVTAGARWRTANIGPVQRGADLAVAQAGPLLSRSPGDSDAGLPRAPHGGATAGGSRPTSAGCGRSGPAPEGPQASEAVEPRPEPGGGRTIRSMSFSSESMDI